MTAQFAIIDAATVQAILDRLDAMQRSLDAAQISPKPEWLALSAAADAMGCSTATIRRRIAAGAIQARGSGKTRQVRLG